MIKYGIKSLFSRGLDAYLDTLFPESAKSSKWYAKSVNMRIIIKTRCFIFRALLGALFPWSRGKICNGCPALSICVCVRGLHTHTHTNTHYPCQSAQIVPAVPLCVFLEGGVCVCVCMCVCVCVCVVLGVLAMKDFWLVESKAAHCYIISSPTTLKQIWHRLTPMRLRVCNYLVVCIQI